MQSDIQTLRTQATQAYNQSDLHKALLLYTEIIDKNTPQPIDYLNRASIYNITQKYNESIQDCKKAL